MTPFLWVCVAWAAAGLVIARTVAWRIRDGNSDPEADDVAWAIFVSIVCSPLAAFWCLYTRPGACAPRDVRKQRALEAANRALAEENRRLDDEIEAARRAKRMAELEAFRDA